MSDLLGGPPKPGFECPECGRIFEQGTHIPARCEYPPLDQTKLGEWQRRMKKKGKR